jgi:ankyrin repeat protein
MDLINACKCSNKKRINEIIKNACPNGKRNIVNFYNACFCTPLMFAVMNSKRIGLCCIRNIIEAGADVNATDNTKNTPLHYAVNHIEIIHDEIICMLLDYGANINTRNNNGLTPLMILCKRKILGCCDDVINMIIDKISNSCELNIELDIVDIEGKTLLMHAIANSKRNGFVDIIRKILDMGAKTDIKDKNNDTVLSILASTVHDTADINCFEFLMKNSIIPNVNNINNDGNTPLMLASMRLNKLNIMDMCTKLINNGADVGIMNLNSLRPIDYVLKYGKSILTYGLLRLFLPLVNINFCCYRGNSLLLLALKNDKLKTYHEIVHYIIDNSIDVNLVNHKGDTALMIASKYNGHLDMYGIISLLLTKGGNVNNKNNYGKTILSTVKNERIRKLLMEHIGIVSCGWVGAHNNVHNGYFKHSHHHYY